MDVIGRRHWTLSLAVRAFSCACVSVHVRASLIAIGRDVQIRGSSQLFRIIIYHLVFFWIIGTNCSTKSWPGFDCLCQSALQLSPVQQMSLHRPSCASLCGIGEFAHGFIFSAIHHHHTTNRPGLCKRPDRLHPTWLPRISVSSQSKATDDCCARHPHFASLSFGSKCIY